MAEGGFDSNTFEMNDVQPDDDDQDPLTNPSTDITQNETGFSQGGSSGRSQEAELIESYRDSFK